MECNICMYRSKNINDNIKITTTIIPRDFAVLVIEREKERGREEERKREREMERDLVSSWHMSKGVCQ